VSTGEHVRCEGDRLDGGAEVRIQGGADTRRPWSAWFASLQIRGADGNGASEESVLVVRRPLPARGEHQIAHVYLPQACNGTPEHFRFALPDAEPQATNSRALLTWAFTFEDQPFFSGQRQLATSRRSSPQAGLRWGGGWVWERRDARSHRHPLMGVSAPGNPERA
jgi:hypothetical protein